MVFEDAHLLVVNKPAGLNTHAPAPYAGEGIYEWLRHRERRWSDLAILHRLDKETSGVLVFGKTSTANRSLTRQFAERAVRKKYLLLTDRSPPQGEFTVRSKIARAGERYASGARGEIAETRFRNVDLHIPISNCQALEAQPVTGRTHQVRVHAAERGLPILGDTCYGGSPFARACLHAAELALRHPAGGQQMVFCAPVDFRADPRLELRAALLDPEETDAFRLIHGAGDGWPGWYLDRLGPFLLSQSEQPPGRKQERFLASLAMGGEYGAAASTRRKMSGPQTAIYHKLLTRGVRRTTVAEASPRRVRTLPGQEAPQRFTVIENGVRFELSFNEGYSTGLFLDQRDNRRRLLTGHVAADFSLLPEEREVRHTRSAEEVRSRTHPTRPSETRPLESGALAGMEVLNVFAYTCGFSVCAARAGARTISLDLSKKHLEWGRRNFALNGLEPAGHDFIYGDALEWLRRLSRQGRQYGVILLDPPTFSQSRQRGSFRVGRDYDRLVSAALPLLRSSGVLFVSTNAAQWLPEKFLAAVEAAIRRGKRRILQQHYAPQPPDFPVARTEPAHLKTAWLRLA